VVGQALTITQTRFRELVDRIPLGLSLLDQNGRILETNLRYRQALGYSHEELCGKALWDLVCEDRASARTQLLQAIVDTKRAQTREEDFRRKDGTIIRSKSTYVVLPSPRGEPELVLGTLEDLTKRREAEESLRTREAWLRAQHAPATVLSGLLSVFMASGSLEESIPSLLKSVCEGVGWDVGVCWMTDDDGRVLLCPQIWHVPSIKIPRVLAFARHSSYARGSGMPGRVWVSGEPSWQTDISGLDDFTCEAIAEGLRTGYWAPLRAGDTVLGVLGLFRRDMRPADEHMLQALTTIIPGAAQLMNRKRVEEATAERAARHSWITQTTDQAIITIDGRGRMIELNPAVEEIFGYPPEEMIGQPLSMLMPENQRQVHQSGLQRYLETGERRLKWDKLELPGLHKRGHEITLEISIAEFTHRGKRSFTGFLRDTTERRRTEAALTYRALHDAVTDLPNRHLLRDRLQQAVLVARRHGQPLSLLFMDLDRFKDVNDTLGHHSGDLLLQQVSKRIRGMLRQSDTIARLGGDEFGVVLPATGAAGAAQTAERILKSLKQAFVMEGHVFEIGASIGIAVYPHHGEDVSTLMRRADVAMYMAKRTESGSSIYSPEQDENLPSRLLLTRELRFAIESGQLLLNYQPKVDLQSRLTGHAEALMRWRHPDRGMIPPDGFILLAEETGLIRPLTAWALGEALRQCQTWRNLGLDIKVAVNLSARTLHDSQLLNTISELLEVWEAAASSLEVEITESAIMIHPDRAMRTLTQLHSMGVSISIDDFGTGYSSLGYLKRVPAGEIKIDKAFVLDMATNRDDASIVRSVIDLSHNLGLQVVAEGVENKQTLDMLTDLGCDMAQGYYLSPPIPPAQFVSWLGEHSHLPHPAAARLYLPDAS
jgi:diguanylate cyclase (GGDEF)-like protein/PAS domain S-box-containing protein